MTTERIPVWLLTGYLGAGKTTLLSRWLGEPALSDAALVVNELGEVGLDDRLLGRAVDSASLVANACICCTGLPGLEQALTDLWWDRLHRNRPAFGSVVIETTGLADPGPVLHSFQSDTFLQARYQLVGVVVVVSATAGWAEVVAHPEALAQVRHADVLVVSKADLADPSPLQAALRAFQPQVPVLLSAQASVSWAGLQTESAHGRRHGAGTTELAGPDRHNHDLHVHHHGVQARFVDGPMGLDRDGLQRWAEAQRSGHLQRLKGVLQTGDGQLFMAQWALGDATVSLVGFEGPVPRLGLTCIA